MATILHGARSVIFLYISCAPCYDFQRKHTQKKTSKRDRAAKQELVMKQPELYHHPSPMQTNPFWQEEIEAGPNFVKGSKPRSGRGLDLDGEREGKGGKEGSKGSLVKGGNERGLTSASGGSVTPSSPTVGGDSGSVLESQPVDEARWNHKRYQREDEGLWGIDIRVDRLMAGQRFVIDALSSAGTSVGNHINTTIRTMESLIPKFSDSDEVKKETRHPYFVGRNPPVNDLHPPIVTTTPYDTGSMKWMLQPPPAASIMNGKEKVGSERGTGRSRTNSRASTLAPAPGTPVQGIGRQLTGKTIQEEGRSGWKLDMQIPRPRIERQLTERTTEEERGSGSGLELQRVQMA